MARFLSISSGSNGNCYYIGDERTALIVDAGVGFRTVKSRLAGAGVDIASVEMIFVTHDHVDHIRGLASVAQRLSVPVYATGCRCRCTLRRGCTMPSRGIRLSDRR